MELCKIWHKASAIRAASLWEETHTHTQRLKAQGLTMYVDTEGKGKDEWAVRHCLGDQGWSMKSFPRPLCPIARPISPDGLCKNWSLGAKCTHAHANTEAKFHFVIISLPRSGSPVSQRYTLETTQTLACLRCLNWCGVKRFGLEAYKRCKMMCYILD